ncbi:MAG TPA: cell wall hydrolase [Allosphingosinicella sp.]|uniref:cell wall hydrolase n=1 Tax=Allosphingosinicella sp. TaxID=2823234 RepID=UPI002ED7FFC4
MIKFARAGGIAAAVLALGLTTGFAGPSQASRIDVAPQGASYLDHASATMGEGALNEAGDIEAITKTVMQAAEAAVPRPRALPELVSAYEATDVSDQEQDCLASAVYFEARGEQIEGQLAVAEVVLNRVASKKYPDTICEVVEQPWQFSFVNETGRIPEANRASKAWKKAVAISEIALKKAAAEVSEDVLWYHADYVAPVWRKNLDREKKVGVHIFYS